ncbi:tetratricopeptide repeat protein [Hymenobacter properus]|uniref:Tetratricopeptide repeat protein n=1 Tax=Hymenobacter properus TaxID=2791026 RepID=A0A931BF08_9BACT|nr:hypothetical protein [Hymenobacter properus]MBF9141336.1 hypothetical protein [Hymenobacter properus]MBR7720146.1 hypothetical protein [Microvirga sp. SRT04]
MDDLRTTLLTLAPDERRDFGVFIQRQRRKAAGRQDSRLYELLVQAKELKKDKLIAKLYPDEPNPVAYYALRKRLLRHLTDFLLLRQRQLDTTAAASVRGQLTLAQYLFETGIPRLAWSTLRKAEKLARESEQYEPLNAVYNLQIQYAGTPHAVPLDEILPRYRANKKAADEEERANIADSLLRQRLRESRARGRATVAVDGLVQQILAEYDLQEAFARSPSLLSRLMSIARNAMLVRRDFTSFAPFIERCYTLMERRHGFAPAQRGHQLRLLYMLAHALYRSRRFEESVAYLEKGQALIDAGPARQFGELVPRFTFLLAANYAFLRRNAESIALLENALHGPKPLAAADDLTARFQLSFHYFVEGKFAKANQSMLSLNRTDHWLEQHLGLEWMVNRNIGELLIQFELGNQELALTRLRAIERTLREQFPATPAEGDTPAVPVGGPYQAVLQYLSLVREVIEDPAIARRPDFGNRVFNMPNFLSSEREDLQVLSFYAWLRARTLGRPYYDVLLELAYA